LDIAGAILNVGSSVVGIATIYTAVALPVVEGKYIDEGTV
jgi:hypothetical protein